MQFWQFLVLLLVMSRQGLQYRWQMKSGISFSAFSGAPETEVKMNVQLHIEDMWMICMDSKDWNLRHMECSAKKLRSLC
jgi:hypothetical protein